MRSLIILAVVAFALADDALIRQRRDARGGGGYGYSYASARIDGHEMRLAQLNQMLDSLEEKVNAGDDSVPDSMVVLERRLDNVEGDECGKRRRSCGRHSGQCVDALLMCDGTTDCKNGHDEDEVICKNRVPAGRSWSGMAEWTGCLVRSNNRMTVLITGNKRYDNFKTRMFIDAAVVEDYTVAGEKHHDTWYSKGTYDLEAQVIRLGPPKGSKAGIGMECTDAGPRIAHCEFIRESDKAVCGSATLIRS